MGVTYTPTGEDPVRTVTTIDYDSDGYPERAEVQRDSVELLEELFSFDSDGQLEEIVSTELDGTLSLTTTIALDWTDGRVTRVTSEGGGVDDPEGDNVIYTTSSERDLTYDDQGHLESSTLTANLNLEQEIDLFIIQYTFTYDVNQTITTDYTWDDSGSAVDTVQTSQTTEAVSKQDDEETGRTSETVTQQTDYRLDDNSQLEEVSVETTVVSIDNDMNESRTEQEATFELRLSDEGQVTDIDERYVVNGTEDDTDSLDVEYDDEGRIVTIESRDGGTWELEYDDEAAQGATFRSAQLPSVIDLAGRPAFSALGRPTHLSY